MNKLQAKIFNKPFSKWQIRCAYMEFEGNPGGKRRPVLITDVKGSACEVLEITSKLSACESNVRINALTYTGLDRESAVSVEKRRTIGKGHLNHYMGEMSPEDIRRVKDAMKIYL